MSGVPVLELAGVSLIRGNVRLLDAIDLAIGPGERVGIVAESGAGKSQLLRVAIGLLAPLSGHVSLFGQMLDPLGAGQKRRIRQRCGVSFQGGSLISGLSVEENLWLPLDVTIAARSRLRRRLNRLVLDFDIGHLCHETVDLLSAGERRRVALARTFFADPELVLLDEPMGGVPGSSAAIEAALRRQVNGRSRAMLLLTQDAGLARRWCDRVFVLDRGHLVAPMPDDQQPVSDGASPAA